MDNKDHPMSDDTMPPAYPPDTPTPSRPGAHGQDEPASPDNNDDGPPAEKMQALSIGSKNKTTNDKVEKNSKQRPGRPAQRQRPAGAQGSFAAPSGSGVGSTAKVHRFAATMSLKGLGMQAGPSRGEDGGGCGTGEMEDGGGCGGGGDDDDDDNADALRSLVLMMAGKKMGKMVVRKGEAREPIRKTTKN